jgi:hypothetical protein
MSAGFTNGGPGKFSFTATMADFRGWGDLARRMYG